MKYQKAINIWALDSDQRAKLQIGQWVKAGKDGDLGRWCGQKAKSLTDVVAWRGNASWRPSKREYFKTLRQYAAGGC